MHPMLNMAVKAARRAGSIITRASEDIGVLTVNDKGYNDFVSEVDVASEKAIIDVLSRVFKLKCAYLAVESYSGKGVEDQQGKLVFSREMSSTVYEMKGNLLLCDDLSDTGVTLNKSIDWLKKYPPLKGKIKNIKTAVLWKKKDSTFEPDFCAQRLDDNPWIVQPFERYEEIRVEDLVKKHKG